MEGIAGVVHTLVLMGSVIYVVNWFYNRVEKRRIAKRDIEVRLSILENK